MKLLWLQAQSRCAHVVILRGNTVFDSFHLMAVARIGDIADLGNLTPVMPWSIAIAESQNIGELLS